METEPHVGRGHDSTIKALTAVGGDWGQLLSYPIASPGIITVLVQGSAQGNLSGGYTLLKVLLNCIKCSISALFTHCEWW